MGIFQSQEDNQLEDDAALLQEIASLQNQVRMLEGVLSGRLSILSPAPGDSIVLRIHRNLPLESYRILGTTLRKQFPGHEAVLLPDSMDILSGRFKDYCGGQIKFPESGRRIEIGERVECTHCGRGGEVVEAEIGNYVFRYEVQWDGTAGSSWVKTWQIRPVSNP